MFSCWLYDDPRRWRRPTLKAVSRYFSLFHASRTRFSIFWQRTYVRSSAVNSKWSSLRLSFYRDACKCSVRSIDPCDSYFDVNYCCLLSESGVNLLCVCAIVHCVRKARNSNPVPLRRFLRISENCANCISFTWNSSVFRILSCVCMLRFTQQNAFDHNRFVDSVVFRVWVNKIGFRLRRTRHALKSTSRWVKLVAPFPRKLSKMMTTNTITTNVSKTFHVLFGVAVPFDVLPRNGTCLLVDFSRYDSNWNYFFASDFRIWTTMNMKFGHWTFTCAHVE